MTFQNNREDQSANFASVYFMISFLYFGVFLPLLSWNSGGPAAAVLGLPLFLFFLVFLPGLLFPPVYLYVRGHKSGAGAMVLLLIFLFVEIGLFNYFKNL